MNPALRISSSSSSSSGAESSLLGAVPLSSALGAGGAASPQQDARASPAVKPRCCCCWKRRHRSSATETKGTEVPNKSQGERWPKHSPETSSAFHRRSQPLPRSNAVTRRLPRPRTENGLPTPGEAQGLLQSLAREENIFSTSQQYMRLPASRLNVPWVCQVSVTPNPARCCPVSHARCCNSLTAAPFAPVGWQSPASSHFSTWH